ncbi:MULTISPECIES: hypothetical protein [unclassified Nocardia]|uniref:hypothetical protein n=1 Tax=unclassified Nocardia TaxID=2637762 RepID=UPI00278C0CD1|nr:MULTISPECIES: hypothetical protein [unclassified Nocardia]
MVDWDDELDKRDAAARDAAAAAASDRRQRARLIAEFLALLERRGCTPEPVCRVVGAKAVTEKTGFLRSRQWCLHAVEIIAHGWWLRPPGSSWATKANGQMLLTDGRYALVLVHDLDQALFDVGIRQHAKWIEDEPTYPPFPRHQVKTVDGEDFDYRPVLTLSPPSPPTPFLAHADRFPITTLEGMLLQAAHAYTRGARTAE